MNSSPAIRPARRADVSALTEIRRDAILSLAAPEMGEKSARDWAHSSADERVVRAIEKNEVWVAERVGAPAGWVEIARDRIEGLYVRPDLAGAGIGSALLLHAEGLIRSAGHRSAALDASSNAEEFYLRRGYEVQAGGRATSGLPMRKPLHGTTARRAENAETE